MAVGVAVGVVVGLWFHAVHWAHFKTMAKNSGHYVEGLFQFEWELDPAVSFQESVARSRPRQSGSGC